MSRVNELLTTATTQLNESIPTAMQDLKVDMASVDRVRTFQTKIPFKWKAAQAFCKIALFFTAWERYADWYDRRDKKHQLGSMSPPATPEKAEKAKKVRA